MSFAPSQRTVYLDVGPDAIFGQLHMPTTTPLQTAVLIAPPWGWDAVASHRSLRAWAQHLTSAGHLTLRFDLPATGDSGGTPRDEARLETWVAALTAAVDWLRDESGCGRIATLGLGLGGLIAAKALAEGARIDDLVLWATPVRGRAFVHEQRAFSELQASRMTLTGKPEPSDMPEGWLEAGGFVLAADTIAALQQVDLRTLRSGGLQRALLLERDGAGIDARLRAHLEEAGVDVTTGAGAGWEAMVFHPERPDPPEEVFASVTSWLTLAPEPEVASRVRTPEAAREIVLEIDGARVRESSLTVQLGTGRLVGVLAEPVDAPTADLSAVFLNAGAVRRIGPNRIWVEASRRWAARGVPTLRIDLEGIGEADGDASRYRDVTEFYVPGLVDQVSVVLDALETRGLGDRFVVTGLCSGGYWAFQSAIREERISAALLVNSGALVWDDELVTRREGHKVARLRQLIWWRKILRGDVTITRMRAIGKAYVRHAIRRLPLAARTIRWGERAIGGSHIEMSVDRGLDRLRDADTRLVLAFSGDEALHAELEQDGVLARLDRWPNVELELLPARDHTLRPIVAQRAVHELLDRKLASELDRAGHRASRSSRGASPTATVRPPSANRGHP